MDSVTQRNDALLLALNGQVPALDRSMALPRIGCGIGGLHWPAVREVLARIAQSSNVEIEVWSL